MISNWTEKRGTALVLSALLMLAASGVRAQGADLRETGRRLAKEKGSAIVTVKIVASMKMSAEGRSGDERERKTETCGTVVAPDGTTIVPLSELDPSAVIKKMAGAEGEKMTISNTVKDLKIVVDKKTEIPATVIKRDPDLDLAVIRPTQKPKEPMKAIDVTNQAVPKLLDEVLVLARMKRACNYEIGVMTGEIQAIVAKPRTFYVPSAELGSGGLGTPIFSADGKFVGITLMRVPEGGGEDQESNAPLVTILPADDVRDIIAQAK
jgi:hypothetical protein